jgi:Zn-dependent protease
MAEQLALGGLWYVVFLLSITVHESAHAWVALRGGDPTAERVGQVSLDPLPHIRREPLGTVVLPILTYFTMGWMMGWASAPYDPAWADRHPRRAAWMALAGPFANLLLCIFAGVVMHAGLRTDFFLPPPRPDITSIVEAADPGFASAVATFLSILFVLNALLFTFNLIPIPPLDGASAITVFFPEDLARRFTRFLYGLPMIQLVGMLAAWRASGILFPPVLRAAILLVYGGVNA